MRQSRASFTPIFIFLWDRALSFCLRIWVEWACCAALPISLKSTSRHSTMRGVLSHPFLHCSPAFAFTAHSPRNHLSFLKAFSSLAPPTTLVMEVGQTLVGAKWNYRLVKPIKTGVHKSNVFKARILPGSDSLIPAKWSVIPY